MKEMARKVTRSDEYAMNSRNTVMDIVSSVSGDGRIVNTITHNKAERRDITVIAPYGIASSAMDGMMVEVINNDITNRSVAIGVNDRNKPSVSPGEVILYSNFGCTISMKSDGNIVLKSNSGKSVTIDEIYDHLHP